ncbi:MAG: CHAT domain-containing protein, partial [Phycisphaerae bacterium]
MRQFQFNLFEGARLRFLREDGGLLGERPLDKDQVDQLVTDVKEGYQRSSPDLAGLGRRLYEWLDGSSERWLAKARNGEPGLAIHIDVEQRLRHLPWELLSQDHVFLCGQPGNPFTPVRRVNATAREVGEPANRPLRVLFMACSPHDAEPVLDYEAEERRILDATKNQEIELVVEERGSPEGLAERAEFHGRDHFDVLHLTGHATIQAGIPILLMEDDVGGSVEVTADDIVRALGNRWPRLIFLSGCKTGESAESGVLPSLCEAVVQAGGPAVLGWALPVRDDAATAAAAILYHHLAVGMRIDEAVARARAELFEQKHDDWHLLRLYADATPLAELVTPAATKGRARLQLRQAQVEFLDAGSRGEVCPREKFVGRRRPIQRCLRVLRSKQGSDEYREGVLLHGIGGLGKSSLAARLCERMERYQRFVWVGAIDELAVIGLLADRIADPKAGAILNEAKLTLKQRLRGMLTDFIADKPGLFVFDDFEQNVEGHAEGKPRLDQDGRGVLKPAALDVLRDLMEAIRQASSESRVIVTCRYRIPPQSRTAELHEESLEHFQGAELEKKVKQLVALSPQAGTQRELREQAMRLAAGNPRLLERLDAVLRDEFTNHVALLAALEAKAEEFREETLLKALLEQQSPDARKLVAMLAVCDLPIDRAAVEAIAGDHPVDPHLQRIVGPGLLEAGVHDGSNEPRYFVSTILRPLLDAELSDEERVAAARRAARHLYEVWWEQSDARLLPRALAIHRLAMLSAEKEIAVVVADAIATSWIDRSRFREAGRLCEVTLALGDDYRLLHSLARTEVVLGDTGKARQHYERAL